MQRVTIVPLPVTIAVAVAILSACSAAKECALPWTTMDQLRRCESSNYQTNGAGDDFANIVVPPKADPVTIAGALADALMKKSEVRVGEQAVVAWPPLDTLPIIDAPPGSLGGPLIRFDSGYVAEFQEGLLHFDICTSWIDHPAGGTVCDDRLEFDIEKIGASP
jgi:hypothetical protein